MSDKEQPIKLTWKEAYLVRVSSVYINGIVWTMMHQRHRIDSATGKQRIKDGKGLDEIVATTFAGDYHFDGWENFSNFVANGLVEESRKINTIGILKKDDVPEPEEVVELGPVEVTDLVRAAKRLVTRARDLEDAQARDLAGDLALEMQLVTEKVLGMEPELRQERVQELTLALDRVCERNTVDVN